MMMCAEGVSSMSNIKMNKSEIIENVGANSTYCAK